MNSWVFFELCLNVFIFFLLSICGYLLLKKDIVKETCKEPLWKSKKKKKKGGKGMRALYRFYLCMYLLGSSPWAISSLQIHLFKIQMYKKKHD